MFRCHMLVTDDLRPMGKGIKIVDNWGTLTLVVNDDPKDTITGKHLFLEGNVNAFEAWLAGAEAWMGVGHPQEQRFELTPYGE